MTRLYPLFFLALFLPLILVAQPLRFEQLNVEDGLSQSTVNCMLKDSRGYLWIGTNDGLNRYDGYQFTIFRNDNRDSASISDNKIYALLEDRDGRLWVGTKNGLNLYDRYRNKFRRFMRPVAAGRNQGENFVRSLLQDRQGRLWVGTIDGALSLLDADRQAFTPVNLHSATLSRDQIRDMASILEDHRGELWLASTAPGLFRFNLGGSNEFFAFPSDRLASPLPKKIYEDTRGRIWVATQGDGVYVLEKERDAFTHYNVQNGALPNDIAKDVVEDDGGRIWIATDGGGISIYDPGTETFSYQTYQVNRPFSLGSNAVYTFLKDNEGIIWVGTFDAGISIYNKNRKPFHYAGGGSREGAGLSHRSVLCFLEDDRGAIWAGTDGGGLNRFDPGGLRFEYVRRSDGLSSDVVTALYKDERRRIWIGTYQGGLQCMENGTITATYRHDPNQPGSIRNNNVWSLLEDRRGRFWIGTLGGLDLLEVETGRFRHISTDNMENNLHLERVTALYEDRGGVLWVGGKGLRYYDEETGQLRGMGGAAGAALLTYDIRGFHEDRRGRFWIATEGGGLFLLDRDQRTARSFTVKDGLPSNAVHTILEDETGYLWLSTNQGISRLSPEKLLSDRKTEWASAFRNYTKADGLQSNQFSYSAGLKAGDGAMYFGGINGFNYFYPDQIRNNPYRPSVEIVALKIKDRYVTLDSEDSPLEQPVSELEELKLSYQQSQLFSLEFTALNFTSSEKNGSVR